MKRGLILILLILLITPLVFSQTTDTPNSIINISELNYNFDTSFNIPQELSLLTKIFFGVQGEIPLQLFVILVALWFALFIIISQVLIFVSFFESKITKYLVAAIITTLGGISGGIREATMFFFNLGNLFGILEDNPLAVVVAIVIVGLIVFATNKITKILKKNLDKESARKKGRDIKTSTKLAEIDSKAIK